MRKKEIGIPVAIALIVSGLALNMSALAFAEEEVARKITVEEAVRVALRITGNT